MPRGRKLRLNEKSNSLPSNEAKPVIGRPQGSKTEDVEVIEADPKRCPSCHGTDLQHLWSQKPFDHNGKTRSGAPYNQVRWTKNKCRNCGVVAVYKSYVMIHAKTS